MVSSPRWKASKAVSRRNMDSCELEFKLLIMLSDHAILLCRQVFADQACRAQRWASDANRFMMASSTCRPRTRQLMSQVSSRMASFSGLRTTIPMIPLSPNCVDQTELQRHAYCRLAMIAFDLCLGIASGRQIELIGLVDQLVAACNPMRRMVASGAPCSCSCRYPSRSVCAAGGLARYIGRYCPPRSKSSAVRCKPSK